MVMTEELNIDYSYYDTKECSFEDLNEASNRLTAATQEQFESIKQEKWFTRVFDMATLSRKNEKRMAQQISSLAQAQQILVEILVRLSARDRKISDWVAESFEKIERLSKNDISLALRIKQLENYCILGISKETDIRDLSEKERMIMGGLFFDMLPFFGETSEEQRRYAHVLLQIMDTEAQQLNTRQALETVTH
ncbi:hypothetical protein, partial [Paenibacillus sp.]|uniref:hypothetical protein n=1 Tax=Paenibacillus sp. TaxID=58172 RepID=UPI0028AFA8EB